MAISACRACRFSRLNATLIRNHLRNVLARIPEKGSEFARHDIDEVMETIYDVIEMVAPQCFDSINTLRLEVINKIKQLRRHFTTLLDDENAPEPATSADL